MGKKVCLNDNYKRELFYSFSTLVFTPVLYYFAVTSAFSPGNLPAAPVELDPEGAGRRESSTTSPPEEKVVPGGGGNSSSEADTVISFIVEQRELPFETVFYVIVFEILKLLTIFTVFPGSHLFDQTPSLTSLWNLPGFGSASISGSSKASQPRLPFSKRDRDNIPLKSPTFQTKVLEIWKGTCNFAVGCLICHVFIVLLGAPVLQDWKLTFQFSVILTAWLLSPMCLAVQPSRLLQELMYIGLWNADNEILHRTKWRFAVTAVGAWVGAIVIPLDWDRPWQRWPIPCLTSTIATFILSNLVLTIHLLCSVFGIYHKLYLLSTESSKVKNF